MPAAGAWTCATLPLALAAPPLPLTMMISASRCSSACLLLAASALLAATYCRRRPTLADSRLTPLDSRLRPRALLLDACERRLRLLSRLKDLLPSVFPMPVCGAWC